MKPTEPSASTSWLAEVIADSSGQWSGNGVRVATEAEAKAYVANLMWRWTLVTDTRVLPSTDPVNYRWDAKLGLVAVPSVPEQ